MYEASIKDSMKLGRTLINLSCKEIIRSSPWKTRIKEGMPKRECLKLYNDIRKRIKETS